MGHCAVSIFEAIREPVYKITMCNKIWVIGVLTVGLYFLVIKTTETAFFPL